MNLKEIMQKYNCDKVQHHYYKEYEKEFESVRMQPLNILEVGIWKGTSHSAWIDYFPNAQVYGIDIFERIKPEEVPILKHPRMHWIKGDSTDGEICNTITNAWGEVLFDYIIDDGKHTPRANGDTLRSLSWFMKFNGVYYVEDVWPLDILTEQEWKHSWLTRKQDAYNMKEWNLFMTQVENYSSDYERIDLRVESRMPDSYLFKIQA